MLKGNVALWGKTWVVAMGIETAGKRWALGAQCSVHMVLATVLFSRVLTLERMDLVV